MDKWGRREMLLRCGWADVMWRVLIVTVPSRIAEQPAQGSRGGCHRGVGRQNTCEAMTCTYSRLNVLSLRRTTGIIYPKRI